MWSYQAFCDEFYVNSRLYLKLELDPSRETVLAFFDRIRRAYPALTRLRRREDGALLLEEEAGENEVRRYVRLDPAALKFGLHAPPDFDSVSRYGKLILEQAPAHLSLSELDFDYLEVVYGFDLEYRGNHDELVAEALFRDHPLFSAMLNDEQRVIDCQPFLGFTLSPDCSKQGYVEIKGRTSTFEVRTDEYEPAPLSVFLTVRQYWSGPNMPSIDDVHRDLLEAGAKLAADKVLPLVVQPLANAIASGR